MDFGAIIVAAISAAVGISASVALVLKSKGENKNKAAEVYSAAEDMVAARVKADLQGAFDRIDALETKVDDLNEKHVVDRRQKAEMIRHIIALEALIPNPPGPPARPEWRIEDTA